MATSAVIADPGLGFFFTETGWHNKCKDSPFWDGWYPKLRVAVFAIFLIFYTFVLPTIVWWLRRKHAAAKQLLSWPFMSAMFSTFVWIFILIVADSYLYCTKISAKTYLKNIAATRVFNHLGNIILLGIVAFVLVPMLWKQVNWNNKWFRLGMMCYFGVLAVFAIAGITLRDYLEINTVTGAHPIKDKNSATLATFMTLYLVGAIVVVGSAHAACLYSKRKMQLDLDDMPYKMPVLSLGLLGLAIINMIVTMRYEVSHTHVFTKSASAALGILYLVFQMLAYVGLCLVSTTAFLRRDAIQQEKQLHRDSADTEPAARSTA